MRPQYSNLATAKEFVQKLQSKGVFIKEFLVQIEENGLATTQPVNEWDDDGQEHIFYIRIPGGEQQILNLAKMDLGKGGYHGFYTFFSRAYGRADVAFSAILSLPGVVEKIDEMLKFPEAPPAHPPGKK